MKHLLVTNDFPPKIGGIQSLLWEWWRRLPPDSFAVLTSPYKGAAAFDSSQQFLVERTDILIPDRQSAELAAAARRGNPGAVSQIPLEFIAAADAVHHHR